MENIVEIIGWIFIVMTALSISFGAVGFTVTKWMTKSRPPRIMGAELPIIDASLDLEKRYDIVYGAGHGAAPEKLTGVHILGYLRSYRDKTTGEYMEGGWLVVELPDRRRAYLRPLSVLWLLESIHGTPEVL